MEANVREAIVRLSEATRLYGLPVCELANPVSLAAVALLAVNDHLLKGAGIIPGALTGKISDFAGIFFFPLLLTALVDTLLFVVVTAGEAIHVTIGVDYRLKRWKLIAACVVTLIAFSSIQLWQPAANIYAQGMCELGFPSRVTMDPTDLIALIMLPLSYAFGLSVIRREEGSGR
jgi:hypothetical protein